MIKITQIQKAISQNIFSTSKGKEYCKKLTELVNFWTPKVYEKPIPPDEKIFESAFNIFLIVIDLKLHNPFIKEMVNLHLNVELILDVHEVVRPLIKMALKGNDQNFHFSRFLTRI